MFSLHALLAIEWKAFGGSDRNETERTGEATKTSLSSTISFSMSENLSVCGATIDSLINSSCLPA